MILSPVHRAIAGLLVVTFIWGWTFSWMKEAIDTATRVIGGPALPLIIALFMTLRFGIASAIMPIVLPAARQGCRTRRVWSDGAILGVFLIGGFLLQMVGLDEIDPAVSAFLTSLYVAFTAVFAAILDRRMPGPSLIIGVIVVTVGAATISGPPQLTFDTPEWLTVACALLFAGHIMATDRITKSSPPLPIAWASFVWVALFSLGMLLWAVDRSGVELATIQQVLVEPGFYKPALLAGVFGTLVALSLLTAFQRFLSPVRAAILYALEPVWAAIIAISMGQTTIDGWLLFGGGALLLGNLFVELWPRFFGRKAQQPAQQPAERLR